MKLKQLKQLQCDNKILLLKTQKLKQSLEDLSKIANNLTNNTNGKDIQQ